MDRFIINGARPLRGTIKISGNKNAATVLIAASLLNEKETILKNLPLNQDVLRMIEITKSLGAEVSWLDEKVIKIKVHNLSYSNIDKEAVSKLRSSILFVGPMVARLKKYRTPYPGGCNIGARPLTTHFDAFRKMGIEIQEIDDVIDFKINKKLSQNLNIVLREFSVTATENLLMLASGLKRKIIITLAAAEPHIENLTQLLRGLNIEIKWIAPHKILIDATNKKDKKIEIEIQPDYIEVGSFIALGAISKGSIEITNFDISHLDIILEKFKEAGVGLLVSPKKIRVAYTPKFKPLKIQTMPYPGLATDLQPQFGTFLTQANGTSLIQEPLYEGRLNYLKELNKMGANTMILDPHRAIIIGPTPLYGKEVESLDIRTGISILMAGLIAQGKTIINDAYQIDRGYEQIVERLQKLGADIKREHCF